MSDLVLRRAAIDAIAKLLAYHGSEGSWIDQKEALDTLRNMPSAHPYKTDHGFIWLCPECGLEVHSDFQKCVRCGHERADTAQPEWKKGKWVRVDEKPYFRKHFDRECCSECHMERKGKWLFCPYCGADMRGNNVERREKCHQNQSVK